MCKLSKFPVAETTLVPGRIARKSAYELGNTVLLARLLKHLDYTRDGLFGGGLRRLHSLFEWDFLTFLIHPVEIKGSVGGKKN